MERKNNMFLTEEQQAILNGSKGETMAKVMESVVRYGELFGAEKLIPVTSKYNHLVTSFGLKAFCIATRSVSDAALCNPPTNSLVTGSRAAIAFAPSRCPAEF